MDERAEDKRGKASLIPDQSDPKDQAYIENRGVKAVCCNSAEDIPNKDKVILNHSHDKKKVSVDLPSKKEIKGGGEPPQICSSMGNDDANISIVKNEEKDIMHIVNVQHWSMNFEH